MSQANAHPFGDDILSECSESLPCKHQVQFYDSTGTLTDTRCMDALAIAHMTALCLDTRYQHHFQRDRDFSVTHKITLNDPWFGHVLAARKTWEGRRHTQKVSTYRVGDLLHISHHTDQRHTAFHVRIEAIRHYRTFEEALALTP